MADDNPYRPPQVTLHRPPSLLLRNVALGCLGMAGALALGAVLGLTMAIAFFKNVTTALIFLVSTTTLIAFVFLGWGLFANRRRILWTGVALMSPFVTAFVARWIRGPSLILHPSSSMLHRH